MKLILLLYLDLILRMNFGPIKKIFISKKRFINPNNLFKQLFLYEYKTVILNLLTLTGTGLGTSTGTGLVTSTL